MNTCLYEKEYFTDNYKEEFNALRSRFHDRTQNALSGRKVDKRPMPNATTIVYLHDEPDGGVSITTGDFVEYFNSRYGDQNRIGAMRKALSLAEKKAEQSGEYAKQQRCEKARQGKSTTWQGRVRATRRPLTLANAFFALMLVVSIGLLGGSATLLQRAETVETPVVAEVQAEEITGASRALPTVDDSYVQTVAENSVEVYEAEEASTPSLLSALAFWGE